jgi:hypothetical protein
MTPPPFALDLDAEPIKLACLRYLSVMAETLRPAGSVSLPNRTARQGRRASGRGKGRLDLTPPP